MDLKGGSEGLFSYIIPEFTSGTEETASQDKKALQIFERAGYLPFTPHHCTNLLCKLAIMAPANMLASEQWTMPWRVHESLCKRTCLTRSYQSIYLLLVF
jgi:hypothetical protein